MTEQAEPIWTDASWTSPDGLKLHYRDHAGPGDRPAVLCLHGLTRNARDFDGVAARLAGEWRVICPDMRGRGDSQYAKDSATYNPLQYVQDVAALIAQAGLQRIVLIGTSLGGLMSMVLAMTMRDAIAGVCLNDIGPVVDEAGLGRIRGYVGQGRSFPTWMHAARGLEEAHGHAYPDFQIADWLVMAKRVMTLSSNGRIVFDYDMKIAEPFASADAVVDVDLWPGLEAIAGRPALFLRGELSDILSAATLEEMGRRVPGSECVTVPRVGHAPTLDEPESIAALARLMARIA